MKKTIIILLLILPITVGAEKIWVEKNDTELRGGIRDFKCIDSTQCFATLITNDYNIIYKSTNQGDSWEVYAKMDRDIRGGTLGMTFTLDSLYFYLHNNYDPAIDVTTDGGETWKLTELKEAGDLNLRGILMFDRKIGVAFSFFNLFVTKDNWETYTSIDMTEYKGSGRMGSFFLDSNNLVLKTSFGGCNFIKYDIANDEWESYSECMQEEGEEVKQMMNVSFVNDSVGYAVGSQNSDFGGKGYDIVWKTTNKGKGWDIVLYDPETPRDDLMYGLTDVSFKDELHGFASGWGLLVETTDGGDTWNYHELPYPMNKDWEIVPAWAGAYPLLATSIGGFYRLEEATGIDKYILDSKAVKVRQTANNLLISIEDDKFRLYNISIVDINGNILQEATHRSGIGTVFKPIRLVELINGVYFYKISTSDQVVKTGKISIIN
jgi:photosystem II stability/assembly factor-like uncharacterized protein